jgi:hypothetical protein
MSVPYGLTKYAIRPVEVVPGLRFNKADIPKAHSQGERRAIATFVSFDENSAVVRATRPGVSSCFVLWSFVRHERGWKKEGKPTCQGGGADEMELRDTLTTAVGLMNNSGRSVRE